MTRVSHWLVTCCRFFLRVGVVGLRQPLTRCYRVPLVRAALAGQDVLAQLSKLEPGDPRRPAAVELVTSNFDKFSDNGDVSSLAYAFGNRLIDYLMVSFHT